MTNGQTLRQIGPMLWRQRVLESLRGAIGDGRFRPGYWLVEEELCQQLGVSRGPVRGAQRRDRAGHRRPGAAHPGR